MKKFLIRHRLSIALVSAALTLLPTFAQDTTDMLSKALDVVHQVQNAPGNSLPDARRIDLLTQAIKMVQEAPNHRLKGHRVLAIQAIRDAISAIRSGDQDHKLATYLHTADVELTASVSLAGETAAPAGPAASAMLAPAAQTADDFFNQGWAKMHQSDWRGAVADFDQAIKLDPGKVDPYMERGASKLMLGDRAGGMADYDQAIKADPKNTEAYLKRGEALEMKDPKGAIADYQRVIALDPKNKEAYKNLATIKWMHQDYNGTIAAYDQLIALDPKDWYSYGCRALAKGAKGDLDGAIADYDQDILIEPTDFNAFHNRGHLKQKKGDLNGALADLNQAVTLGMHDGYVYRQRADIKKALGDLDGAIADYDQVVTLDSKDHSPFVNLDEVYINRGNVKLTKRDLAGAIDDYNQAIRLHTEDTQGAYFSIWAAQKLLGKKEDADSQLSSEMAKSAGFTWFWPSIVSKFLQGGMNEADFISAAAATDARKDEIQHCQAWYYAGIKRLLAGDKSHASDDFRKCLATNQKDENAYFLAQAELKAMEKQP